MADPILCDTVPLADVAFVHAGVADGLALADLLVCKGIDALSWERADRAFARLFLRRLRDGDAFALEVDALSVHARASWERRLPPLDQDLGAYLDLERHWSASPDPSRFLLDRGMRPSDLIRLDRLWNARLAEDAELRARALSLIASPPGPCPDVHPEPPRLVIERVAPTPDATAAKATLPFREGAAHVPPPSLSTPLPAPKQTGIEGTRDLGDLRQILASLPFARQARPAPPAGSPEGALAAPSVVTPPPVALPLVASSPVTPPLVAPPLVASPPVTPPLVAPPLVAPPAAQPTHLQATSLSMNIPSRDALPFARGAEAPGSTPHAPAPAPRRPPSHLQETSGVFAPPSQALPFAAAQPAPGAGGLTLEQYASLCVDLAADPASSVETLRRYRLTPEQKQAIDAAWSERFTREPGLRIEWSRACTTYSAWLRARQGGSP